VVRRTYDTTSELLSTTVRAVSPIETILIYAVIPVVALLLLFALTAIRGKGKAASYRAGDDWPHEALWWIGNPKGTGLPEPTVEAVGATATRTARGGARGTW
jgi:hypothetical protein